MNTDRLRIIFGGLFSLFVLVLIRAAQVMLLPKGTDLNIMLMAPLIIAVIFSAAALYTERINLREYLRSVANKDGHSVISLVYVDYLRKKYNRIALWLAILSCVILLLSRYVSIFSNYIILFVFPSLLFALLLIRKKLIKDRIDAGVFGTNAEESKELINFMLSNFNDIDFTDGDGKIKKSFLPENLLLENYNGVELEGQSQL